MKYAKRLDDAPLSGIRKMFELAGKDSINLGIGEPDTDPPKEAIEGFCEAARKGLNKYSPTTGLMELRNGIAKHYSKYAKLTGDNVSVTPSGSTALWELSMAFVDKGDEVLVPNPGFVIYGPHVRLSGGKDVPYGLTEGDFQPDIDDIQKKITKNTKMLVVTNPSNPTGATLTEETYKALCDISSDRDITIIADEVYDSYLYEGKHHSFMNRLDNSIVVGGFSKMMCVTGWRLGFIICDSKYIEPLVKAQYYTSASCNMPAMYGALKALPTIEPYLDRTRETFRKRRDLIVKRLNEIDGMHITTPKGAFYAFPSYDQNVKAEELAMQLAGDGLICTPGTAFGTAGEKHLRFSYAANEEKINKGMDILENRMKQLK